MGAVGTALATVAAALALAAPATAAPHGAVVPVAGRGGCFAHGGTRCTTLRGLFSPDSLALAPDGRTLYVLGDRLMLLDRRGDGSLRLHRGGPPCVSFKTPWCLRDPRFNSGDDLMVSPDGRNVYLAGLGVTGYSRAPSSGSLTPLGAGGCLVSDPAPSDPFPPPPGCSFDPVATADGITISADGATVYGTGDGTIEILHRDATGLLTRLAGASGCISVRIAGCTRPPNGDEPFTFVLPGGGTTGYVFSHNPAGTVRVVHRDTVTGELSYAQGRGTCLSESARPGCTRTPHIGQGLVTSPDGRFAYLSGHAIAAVRRNPHTGALTPIRGARACVGRKGSGCTHLIGLNSGSLWGDAVLSPDGRTMYWPAGNLIVLRRDRRTGLLNQLPRRFGCVGQASPHAPCTQTPRRLIQIDTVLAPASGGLLYLASSQQNTIFELRTLTP